MLLLEIECLTKKEWIGFVPSYDQVLGSHPVVRDADPQFVEITDKTFQQYGMTQVRYLRAADGDTVYFESMDPEIHQVY